MTRTSLTSLGLKFSACLLGALFLAFTTKAQPIASTNDGDVTLTVKSRANAGTVNYITVYMNVTATGQSSVGQWMELPYTGPLPEVQVTDTSPYQISATAGYILSPTLIPLDQLNLQDYPPGDFTPLPGLSGGYTPGQTDSTPDGGSTVILLGMGAAGLAILGRRL